MIKNRKQMIISISAFILVLMLTTVTFAFFNYTRTGTANVIRTGKISFTSSQNNTINLTNVFPIERSSASTDNANASEVEIIITGDTTYTDGIEYLITAEDVNIITGNKKIPVGLIITPEKDGDLGISNDDYFEEGERGGNTSYYKVIAGNNENLTNGEYLMVGYIKPGATGVDGTIGIRAFIDKEKIAISDTYDETESDNMGTTNNWVNGRVVLTTEEWNSLQGNNSINFKIKVQANEGIWVGEPLSENSMISPYSISLFSSEERATIKEIKFIRMSEEMINTHSDLINLSDGNGEGVVKAWTEDAGNNLKTLYIASPGETYFPENSSYMLYGYPNMDNIVFENINTSNVTNMRGMLDYNTSLTHIDMSNFDTSSVTDMSYMFYGDTNLESIDLSNMGNSNLTAISSMFRECTNLKEINMSGFNFGSSDMSNIFFNLTNLEKVNLKNANTTNVTDMRSLFSSASKIEEIDLSGLGSDYLSSELRMFSGCTNLKKVNLSNFNFGSANLYENFYNLANLEEVIFTNADMSDVTNISYLFSDCTNLIKVDLSNLGGNSINSVRHMFYRCSSLKEVNMSGFNFGSASDLTYLFGTLQSLESVDLSDANMSNAKNIYEMFNSDTSLVSVDMSNITTGNLVDSYGMFDGCTSLENVNMQGFVFGTGYSQRLFRNCTSLKNVNLTNVDISNIQEVSSIFENCSSLEELDLSSFNTSSLKYTTYAFSGCTNLKTIKVSNAWNLNNVSSSYNMFYGCTSLEGGAGTTYDANYVDKTYGRIDGGQASPGYLTLVS